MSQGIHRKINTQAPGQCFGLVPAVFVRVCDKYSKNSQLCCAYRWNQRQAAGLEVKLKCRRCRCASTAAWQRAAAVAALLPLLAWCVATHV